MTVFLPRSSNIKLLYKYQACSWQDGLDPLLKLFQFHFYLSPLSLIPLSFLFQSSHKGILLLIHLTWLPYKCNHEYRFKVPSTNCYTGSHFRQPQRSQINCCPKSLNNSQGYFFSERKEGNRRQRNGTGSLEMGALICVLEHKVKLSLVLSGLRGPDPSLVPK